jgi:hypothetical protein
MITERTARAPVPGDEDVTETVEGEVRSWPFLASALAVSALLVLSAILL